MARTRGDFAAGAIDSALTTGTTTLSSPGLADLPAVASPNVAAVALFTRNSDGRVTAKEIVHVTAHTAAATTATITRGKEGTTAAAWAIADKWVHGVTVEDVKQSGEVYRLLADLGASTSNTTLSDLTGLAFAITNGEQVEFEAQIRFSSAATTTGPAVAIGGVTATAVHIEVHSWAAQAAATAIDAAAVLTGVTQTAGQFNHLRGYIVASATGTAQLKFRSEISGSAITPLKGSWLKIIARD